jgi:hypothetical protein
MKKAASRAPPIVVKRLDHPDEERRFEKGSSGLVTLGGMELGAREYQPGWHWSKHVGPIAGTKSCAVEHVGLVLSGRAAVKMDDGEEMVLGPGDVFYVPPGHGQLGRGQRALRLAAPARRFGLRGQTRAEAARRRID